MLTPDNRLSEQLSLFGEHLRRAGVPCAYHIAPGEDRGVVAAALRAAGLRADSQVIDFFAWANGYPPDRPNDTVVTPNGVQLIPFSDVLPTYDFWIVDPPETALPGWVPVMRYDRGWILVDCGPDSPDPGRARIFIDGEAYTPVRDLATIVSWWNERLADGRWGYTDLGDHFRGWIAAQEQDRTAEAVVSSAVV